MEIVTPLLPASAKFMLDLPVRARPARPDGEARYHLVLAYRQQWQSLDDLNVIADHVREIEPSIRTFILPAAHRNPTMRKEIATRPTLVVSPSRIPQFRPLRGRVYQGWPMPKLEEVRRLQMARLPVPRTEVLTKDLTLDPAEWGDVVLLKPTDIGTSSHGRGIQLMRTSRVRYRKPSEYPEDHPGRLGPMIVQQYIDTGPELTTYRALMFFDEPLYLQLNVGGVARPPPDADDATLESATVALQAADTRTAELVNDPDVLALARQINTVFPEIPLKGCDFLREAATGKLYVIELNSGGNTWHFSSRYSESFRLRYGPEFEQRRRTQFDAMRTTARVLAAKTVAEAE